MDLLILVVCTVLFQKLYGFKEKRAHKGRDMQFFFWKCSMWNFKILKMFKNNMKFTRAAWCINSEINNRDKSTTLLIFLFCQYCWSLLWCNYWRFLMRRNCTSWIRQKLTVQIQISLHLCDPFLINNHNMTGNSVEK